MQEPNNRIGQQDESNEEEMLKGDWDWDLKNTGTI